MLPKPIEPPLLELEETRKGKDRAQDREEEEKTLEEEHVKCILADTSLHKQSAAAL